MDTVERYQQQLLEQSQYLSYRTPISDSTVRAYLATPRHAFIKRYRECGTTEWHEVRAETLAEHVATLYTNKPLILFGDDDDNIPSTISQPSFVLRMLDLLQLRSGQTVFELGAGSGWNAALIGQLVGPSGRVWSLEVIPEVAQRAADAIEALGMTHVQVVAGDGSDGYAPGAPYDRATFTAGTYDLPRQFHQQVRDGGLVLAPIKNAGGGDNLFLLEKVDDHFESRYSMPCGFVPMVGK